MPRPLVMARKNDARVVVKLLWCCPLRFTTIGGGGKNSLWCCIAFLPPHFRHTVDPKRFCPEPSGGTRAPHNVERKGRGGSRGRATRWPWREPRGGRQGATGSEPREATGEPREATREPFGLHEEATTGPRGGPKGVMRRPRTMGARGRGLRWATGHWRRPWWVTRTKSDLSPSRPEQKKEFLCVAPRWAGGSTCPMPTLPGRGSEQVLAERTGSGTACERAEKPR